MLLLETMTNTSPNFPLFQTIKDAAKYPSLSWRVFGYAASFSYLEILMIGVIKIVNSSESNLCPSLRASPFLRYQTFLARVRAPVTIRSTQSMVPKSRTLDKASRSLASYFLPVHISKFSTMFLNRTLDTNLSSYLSYHS